MTSVPIILVEDIEAFAFAKPGTAEWYANAYGNENAGLIYVCPCGCGNVSAIPVRLGEKVQGSWQWNGDVEKPTLSPSIQKKNCNWHGYLTDGVFVPC